MKRLVAALVVVLVLAIPATAAAYSPHARRLGHRTHVAAVTPTGIGGTVTIGPTRPFCPWGSTCTVPYSTTVTATGPVTVSVATAADGTYAMDLVAGTYTVSVPKTPLGYPRSPAEQIVTVTTGTRLVVDFRYDSGLR